MKYFLKNGVQLVRVCKKMFAGTLGLKERGIVNWVREDYLQEPQERENLNKKSKSRQSIFQERNSGVEEFLKSLPTVDSHYCRSSSTRRYLEPIWRSKSEVYQFYKNEYCKEKKIPPVSDAKFLTIMQKMDISVFRPKKDQCDVCIGHQTKNVTDEVYNLHQVLKEEARTEKEKDKQTENAMTFTMDLQSVLLSPKTNVSAMYYKTKLMVHNFTIYNLQTKEAYCFLWNEAEGQTTAQDFASILIYFLEDKVVPKAKETGKRIILFSDGCASQNRNSILSNALFHFASVNNVTILQKYLTKGHTQMEVDSMHSSIERVLRRTKIHLPADYIEVCKSARRRPFPYQVEYFTHGFFRNFSMLNYFSSIRPGRTVGDPTVMDIKALKYENGTLMYKLRHTSEIWKELPTRKKRGITRNIQSYRDLPPLYIARRKIKEEKYQHLKALLQGLNEEYHDFYINLPHE